MDEIFKDVVGYEDLYEISNLGNIWAKERQILNNGTYYTRSRLQLKPASNGIGYLQVGLTKDGKRTRKYIHRLVLEAFEGVSEIETHHIDKDKQNNRLDNLEYVSNIRNCQHRDTGR